MTTLSDPFLVSTTGDEGGAQLHAQRIAPGLAGSS